MLYSCADQWPPFYGNFRHFGGHPSPYYFFTYYIVKGELYPCYTFYEFILKNNESNNKNNVLSYILAPIGGQFYGNFSSFGMYSPILFYYLFKYKGRLISLLYVYEFNFYIIIMFVYFE